MAKPIYKVLELVIQCGVSVFFKSIATVANWAVWQQERSTQAFQRCCAVATHVRPRMVDTLAQGAQLFEKRASICFEFAQQKRAKFAAGSALSANVQMGAAAWIAQGLPAVTLSTTSAWLYFTLTAASFGWSTADCPLAAVGIQLGAALGTTGAIVTGSSFVVAALLIGVASGVGGSLGYLLTPVTLRGAAVATRVATPDATPVLTRARLNDWANAAGISAAEKVVRRDAMSHILRQQPWGFPYSTNPIVIEGDLNFRDTPDLTELPDGLSVGGCLSIRDCTNLTHLPTGLNVGGDLNLTRCTRLTSLPAELHIGKLLYIHKCGRLENIAENIRLNQGQVVLQALQQGHKRFGIGIVQSVMFTEKADRFLRQVPENERYEVLCITSQLALIAPYQDSYERLLIAVIHVPAVERVELPELLAPLLREWGPRLNLLAANMVLDVCLTPPGRRAARVEELVVEMNAAVNDMGIATATNVHEGSRDTTARATVKKLWFGAGVRARTKGAERTFAAIDRFIESTQAESSSLTAYLKRPEHEGQTHLQRARLTLRTLCANSGTFTVDIESRQEESLAEVVSMLYNLASTVEEGSAEQIEATRDELRRMCVAALSESLASQDGATYCAQGIVQRMLTPLQGYYPEVRLDAFEPPTEGDLVTAFARGLTLILDQAAPDTDRSALIQQHVAEAVASAEDIYAPSPDVTGSALRKAQRVAAARIEKVRRDIDEYLKFEELI
jgi:hypothetical protein